MPESLTDVLGELVRNLASSWNGGREIIERLRATPDAEGNPWVALQRLSEEDLAALFPAPSDKDRIQVARQALNEYLKAISWYERAAQHDGSLAALRQGPIAYFCAEFGLEAWLPLYSGGLGILAGDVLKECSDMGFPLVGVGLFYRHGFFSQHLDATGYQQETYPNLDPKRFPLERELASDGKPLLVPVPIESETVFAGVWKLTVGRVFLYLLDTDVPENASSEHRGITSSLYGGGQETRIQQELVLGIGGVRALRALQVEPRIFSMNEGHAAFLGLELLAERLGSKDVHEALLEIRRQTVYTNHTVVPEGNDVFGSELVRRYAGPYAESIGLGLQGLLDLGSHEGRDGFSMADLAFRLSGRANAVSRLHAEVIPREWPGSSVEAVTNGVHVPSWVGPEMSQVLDVHLPDWCGDAPEWGTIQNVPPEVIWSARNAQRARLAHFVNEAQSAVILHPDALTVVWARRFAEYKRAWLVASDISRLRRLLSDPERVVQIVFSGKAHPRDEAGKRILQDLLTRISDDDVLRHRVAFVEDYNEEIARYLVMGADLWLNTPRKPFEASGTSGMKAGDNGALQLTVRDGWAAEVDWYEVGWGIEGRGDEQDGLDLYNFLEGSIIPTFFDRDAAGVPQSWIGMMKRSMMITLRDYSSRRMMLDYVRTLYRPLLEEQIAHGEESVPAG